MSASRSARSYWTERSVVAAVMIAASAVTASAQPAETPVRASIETPAEWPEQPELAEGIAKELAKAVDFGGLETTGGASAFLKAQTGIIYVSWLATTGPSKEPEAAIRAALDQLRAVTEGLGEVTEIDYLERRVGQAIEVKRVWREVANETITLSRAFLWKSPEAHLRLVRGECVFAESDREAVAPVCDRALITLSADAVKRDAVGELGAVAGPAPTGPAAGADAGAAANPSIGPADSESLPRELYRDKSKPKSRTNLWLFIAGGVLIVFALWVMTRGRRETAAEPAAEPSGGAASEEEE